MPGGEQRKAISWGTQRQKLNIIVIIKSEYFEGCKQVMKYELEMVEGKPFWMSCQGSSHHTKTYTIWKVNCRKIQNIVGTEQSLFKSSTDKKWWILFIVKQDLESPGRWTSEHAFGGGNNLGYHHWGGKTHLLQATAFPGWAPELYQWRKGLRNSVHSLFSPPVRFPALMVCSQGLGAKQALFPLSCFHHNIYHSTRKRS